MLKITDGYAEAVGYTGVLGDRARALSLWINTSVESDMDLALLGCGPTGCFMGLIDHARWR